MTIKNILKMGNKLLQVPSLPVEDFSTQKLLNSVKDMKETLEEHDGIGIAAPQIGVNLRIIMFGYDYNRLYPEEGGVPFTILINPTFEILDDTLLDDWEACLSVPGLQGLVPRYKKIKYTGFDVEGSIITRIADRFHARNVQHEIDHLDGILYPQRINDLRYFGYRDELKG